MRGRFVEIIAADSHVHRIATVDASAVPGLVEHRADILDQIASLIVELAPEVLSAETPDADALRRGALSMVGGANQLIEAWLSDPKETPAELAAIAANLCVAVVDGMATG
ncbi:hypothetical protein H7I41_12920 [Mycobacterium manitobense]|uniref:Uncharacterized protein n=1 Tax=[Mycobacterium] manitobense TaxID=190147 RepID=A0A9X2YNX7_9MYCO|nr:hypothetical protein [[Mycobacterium] manitobense]MCV7170815.1 hypothetical protein [[Mycobacterium] manitobense]